MVPEGHAEPRRASNNLQLWTLNKGYGSGCCVMVPPQQEAQPACETSDWQLIRKPRGRLS